ncbi:ABC transporter substrate-binding protein [soil metagenome]
MKWASLVALAALALVAGCGKGNFSQKASESKLNVFRYPIVTSPTSLDPGKVQDGDTIDALQQTFEGLVGWGEDNKPTPILAEKWEITDGGRSYVFTLKKDLKFSSGNPVTAEDFKACLERNCDPKFASPTAETYMTDIVGVKDVIAGKTKEIDGVQVIDPMTLKITIDKPRPYFLGKLTYPIAFVFDRKALADPSKEMKDVSEMIGTGPYAVSKFVPEQVMEFKANPSYHGGAPKIDGIQRPVVKDPAQRLQLFRNGEVDLVQLERQDLKGVQDDPALKPQLKLFDRPAFWYIGMSLKGYAPFKDVRVRQAVAQAIDVDNIVDNILGGVNKKADGIVPAGVFGHRDSGQKTWKYDPEAARKKLAEAGYPDGKGLPDFEMSFRESRPDIALVAQQVASDLKKNLNMNVTLRTMEWASYLTKNNKKQIPFFHMRWAADYLDAENFLSTLLASYGHENKVYYSNPQFDALCREADTSLDEKKRLELYGKAEDIALQDAPYLPIYFQRDAELISPRVKGLRESAFGHLPHTTVTLQ